MKREDCYTLEEKMLFDIREGINGIFQELKLLNSKIKSEKAETKPEVKAEAKTENKAVPSSVPCKYCGGTHKNRQQMAACAKKKKKEGMNDVSANRSGT